MSQGSAAPARPAGRISAFKAPIGAAACSGGNRDAQTADPAKLSAELEQRAQTIEERAAVAVRDAETQAEQHAFSLGYRGRAQIADIECFGHGHRRSSSKHGHAEQSQREQPRP